MNEMVLEQVELLVTRQLDGRITDDELVELEEICLREPDADHLAKLLRRDHQEICAALKAVIPAPILSVDLAPPTVRLRWWQRFRPISALAAGVALLIGVGLASWSTRSSTAPARLADAGTKTDSSLVTIPANFGSNAINLHNAMAPPPRGSVPLVHDTGASAGWVRDVLPTDPASRTSPEYLGVEHGKSVLLFEVPRTTQPSERY